MVARRFRRPALALLVIALAAVVAALVAGQIATRDSAATAASAGEGNMPAALAKHLAKLHHASGATFAPPGSSNYLEGDQAAQDAADAERAIPGNDIPAAALQQSVWDWSRYSGRGAEGTATWQPLGPTYAKGLPNPYRDRSVYTAGTPNFSGRTVAEVIDPNCGAHGGGDGADNNNGDGSCRLWIANANGGIWETKNALSPNPQWRYLSRVFEHNNTASIVLDPNDPSSNTLWVGTGEPNACGSGCEAGVGLYKSTDGGSHWSGPYGQSSFYDRAVGSIAVQPGNSQVIFAASGRAIRGLSSACCGGADALIPGAPHFGLYRSKDGGRSWELVNQGAAALCTAFTPDQVSLNTTPCSARGARRVEVDPVDPHTVYASFFGRGVWRSNSDGDVGTWTQIYAGQEPVQSNRNERDEFDVVKLPAGTTRMYVGSGGGNLSAKLFRSDDVRTGTPVFTQMTGPAGDTPQASSRGYCDTQCSYDNYVFAPAAHFPNSGATPDTVYLSGSEVYSENNWGPASVHCCPDNSTTGRSNGRAVILSTDGGATFTDMTDDNSDPIYPVELHPDHHGLTVNPTNYKQFFDVSDGGVTRSNGVFVDQSSYCGDPNVKGYTGTHLTFCQYVLSRTPEKLQPINPGLRTLHFYKLNYAPYDPSLIVAGAQDNGSWEIGDINGSGTNSAATVPNSTGPAPTNCRTDTGNGNGGDDGHDDHNSSQNQVWVQINIADGGQNNFDIGDPCFRQSTWQSGQLMVSYAPKNQVDMNWIGDTLLGPYGSEGAGFETATINDPVTAHWLWTGRQHLFRSENQGRNPAFTKEQHRHFCNVWYGTFDQADSAGNYIPCDDWQPLGDPGPGGRLTGPAYGLDKTTGAGDYISTIQRSRRDTSTIWAGTAGGRVLISKNADATDPTAVVFDRIDNDPTAGPTPPRFVSAIAVDPNDANHAIVTFSGFNAKTPGTPGHVFDVHYKPNATTWTLLDGNQPRDQLGDIPATSVALTAAGTIYVGTDYGVVTSTGNGVWKQAGDGLPALVAADMMYVPETQKIYVATHGQGVWSLAVDGIESRHQHDRDNGHGGGH